MRGWAGGMLPALACEAEADSSVAVAGAPAALGMTERGDRWAEECLRTYTGKIQKQIPRLPSLTLRLRSE